MTKRGFIKHQQVENKLMVGLRIRQTLLTLGTSKMELQHKDEKHNLMCNYQHEPEEFQCQLEITLK